MGRALALTLLAALASCGPPAPIAAPAPAQESARKAPQGVELHLRAERETFGQNAPLVFHASLRNTSNQPVEVRDPNRLRGEVFAVVLIEDGKIQPFPMLNNLGRTYGLADEDAVVVLAPGEEIDLDRWARTEGALWSTHLTDPGTYTFQAVYPVVPRRGVDRPRFRSNNVTARRTSGS